MPGHGKWAADGDCPKCDYVQYDMRKRRIIVLRRSGVRVGFGPSKRDPGVDCVWCCVVM